MNKIEKKIGIIGLGYVGLPLSVAFAEKYKVIGFDINSLRINELNSGHDSTLEIQDDFLKSVLDTDNFKEIGLHITTKKEILNDCNVYIVTVPTPTDKHNRPVLSPLIKASETIAEFLKKGDIVIYESTVYPGVTEDEMVPVLEKISGLVYNVDFFCGYSPERINPGDKEHTVTNILKVTSGSTPEIANVIDELYKSVITAGTFKASSIKVAEAAKVIENSQRDINIAFVNELSKIFNLIGIDTHEVLEAASTKWNFINFKPGLVGGHCIGVDPYYLAQKAQEVGYHPEIILAGRRINDSMGKYVATEVLKLMTRQNTNDTKRKVLLLGFTFKEDCPDIRNTRVIDIYNELVDLNIQVDIYDPWADAAQVKRTYDIDIKNKKPSEKYTAVVLAVAHKLFLDMDLRSLTPQGIVYDVKGVLPKSSIDSRL
ncbi:nucleotide sugar dehydrogenase [Flavobacterium sp.]|jgi:UDP-N-acetyl-D-galactosamine dehydrogenase|uniref:nucleotide sugar dehydrogenase n=1 Tax=Flavobacterium sp. TaxID=239 RepID=UPI0037BF192D